MKQHVRSATTIPAQLAWAVSKCILLVFLVGEIVGCSRQFEDKWSKNRPSVFKAVGSVTWNGEPAAGAVVTLQSKSHNLAASGKTDAAGKFMLTTWRHGDGAVAGDHSVTISTWEVRGHDGEGNPIEVPVMPAKYEQPETSELITTIAEHGENVLSFEVSGPRRSDASPLNP